MSVPELSVPELSVPELSVPPVQLMPPDAALASTSTRSNPSSAEPRPFGATPGIGAIVRSAVSPFIDPAAWVPSDASTTFVMPP